MSYLYGDSSPSPLTENFLELLRDALDLFVSLERAGQRLDEARERLQAWRQATEVEVARMEALDHAVARALAGAATGAADSPTARCATAIERAVAGVVRGEIDQVTERMAEQIARADAEARREGDSCVRALETYVRRHDLPETTSSLALRAVEGAAYAVEWRASASLGITFTLALDVPAGHLYAAPLRLERVVERLEVAAPEASGWLQKKVKVRPQRLERHYLIALVSDPGGVTLQLRATATGGDGGFDLRVPRDGSAIYVISIDDKGAALDEPFEVGAEDRGKLAELSDKLVAATTSLLPLRKTVTQALLDGKPLAMHAQPTLLAERLLGQLAPQVLEIAARSQPGELVIKRLLGDGRREEIFLSKDELDRKLDEIPDARRGIYDGLRLDREEATEVDRRRTPPPVPPATSRPPSQPPTTPRTSPVGPAAPEPSTPSLVIDDSGIVVLEIGQERAPSTPPPTPRPLTSKN